MHPPQRTRPVHTPRNASPQGPPPSPEILAGMGEEGVFRMLADFYLELERSALRGMFPADMAEASRKSAAFFVQLLGGRPLFSQTYGPPQMRKRHLPFEIDAAARGVWLECFERVLANAVDRYSFPAEHLEGFRAFLHSFSAWMVNTQ